MGAGRIFLLARPSYDHSSLRLFLREGERCRHFCRSRSHVEEGDNTRNLPNANEAGIESTIFMLKAARLTHLAKAALLGHGCPTT